MSCGSGGSATGTGGNGAARDERWFLYRLLRVRLTRASAAGTHASGAESLSTSSV